MLLSILICSLESRKALLRALIDHLSQQISNHHLEAEIRLFIDNKENSTGFKRKKLLENAHGKYIVFIDDDDWVPDYYIEEMLLACKSDADCIAINGIMTTNGAEEIKWYLSKDYENINSIENGKLIYLRKTNHITAVKREHALKASFPDRSNAEDKWYSDRLNQYLKSEFIVQKPMYHYRYLTQNKQYA